jgi:glucose/arabinose dehydrogenase
MKLPGETSVQSNIIKPVPLDATESRIAALKVAPGLKIEILIEGLKAPRVIVAAPGGTLYVSSRDEGTISLVPLPGSRPGTIKTVLTKPDVHSLAMVTSDYFYVTIREDLLHRSKWMDCLGRNAHCWRSP